MLTQDEIILFLFLLPQLDLQLVDEMVPVLKLVHEFLNFLFTRL